MESVQSALNRCGAALNEPRYAIYFYLAALLLHSTAQAISIVCIVTAWTSAASEGMRAFFVLCAILSVAACQHWLQATAHRYWGKSQEEQGEMEKLVNQ